MIRNVKESDASAIVEIYNDYIANTAITFETTPVSDSTMKERIQKTLSHHLPWLVATDQQQRIIGYAYATPWRERYAYRFSVEITVYLAPNSHKKGVGTELYRELFAQLEQLSVHSVIGGITLPNPASVALHEKFGMRQVAHFKEVGFKFECWQDVGYWQGIISHPNI
jgi:phosphinothricin acetyltransferase